MQYALFEEIKNQATIDTKPVAGGKRGETVSAAFRASAATDAGFSGFGIATGHSGQRYVFAQTTVEQAMLYDKALFAVGTIESGEMIVSGDALPLWFDGIPEGMNLFVHVLDPDSADSRAVLEDLKIA